MKKLLLKILSKTGQILGWKWLYFIAGIGILSSIQSCKYNKRNCYAPVFIENDSVSIIQNDSAIHNNLNTHCYNSVTVPADSVKTDQKNPEIEKIPGRSCYAIVTFPDTVFNEVRKNRYNIEKE